MISKGFPDLDPVSLKWDWHPVESRGCGGWQKPAMTTRCCQLAPVLLQAQFWSIPVWIWIFTYLPRKHGIPRQKGNWITQPAGKRR